MKKWKKLPGDRWLRFLKYVILVGFVILLPITVLDVVGQGQPWFCKYICPSGTLLGGIPLIASNPPLRAALSWLFTWKVALLVVLLLLSVLVYRPFCRYLCPLGAVYSVFTPVALYRYSVDQARCTQCGACQKACPMDIPVHKTPNSLECIRCGKCKAACPPWGHLLYPVLPVSGPEAKPERILNGTCQGFPATIPGKTPAESFDSTGVF